MTISLVKATGSTTIGGTEWSLTTDTSGPDVDTTTGFFGVTVDTNAMAAGDSFEFRVYEKSISGGTQRLLEYVQIADVQARILWTYVCPIQLGVGWDMTLKKLAGTDRSLPWSVRSVT